MAQTTASPDKPAPGKPALEMPAPDKPAPKPKETFQSSMAKQRAAIALQRETVRSQTETAVQWQLSMASDSEAPGVETTGVECDRIADPEITPLIESAAKEYQVEPKLLRGVIEQESAFHACAVSAKGAKGLMQLMPATLEQFKVADAFDPKQNIEAGATFLKQLLDKYGGDLKLALAAYNSGPGTVDKAGGIPEIKETQDYVESIMKKLR